VNKLSYEELLHETRHESPSHLVPIYSTSSTRWSFFLNPLPNLALAQHVPYYSHLLTYTTCSTTLATSTHECRIINLILKFWFWQIEYIKDSIFSFIIFTFFKLKFFFVENFNIFESNRMSVRSGKGIIIWYALKILGAIYHNLTPTSPAPSSFRAQQFKAFSSTMIRIFLNKHGELQVFYYKKNGFHRYTQCMKLSSCST
jgi:hypothetical protein